MSHLAVYVGRMRDLAAQDETPAGDSAQIHDDADQMLLEALECLARELGESSEATAIRQLYDGLTKWYE
jgi:hypothetical protein